MWLPHPGGCVYPGDMRQLSALLALVAVACSAPTAPHDAGPDQADAAMPPPVDPFREVTCYPNGGAPAECVTAAGGDGPANCGPPNDPLYLWVPVCEPGWTFTCSPDGERRWLTPCPGCAGDTPTCGDHERPWCMPIPRDCAAGRYPI